MKQLLTILAFIPFAVQAQTYTTRELSAKIRAVETNLSNLTKRHVADSIAHWKRLIVAEEKATTLQTQANELQDIIVKEILDRAKVEAELYRKLDTLIKSKVRPDSIDFIMQDGGMKIRRQ